MVERLEWITQWVPVSDAEMNFVEKEVDDLMQAVDRLNWLQAPKGGKKNSRRCTKKR